MAQFDLSIVALTAEATRSAPDALREAIVARAREASKKLDGIGADIQPLAQQEALLRVARREEEAELRESGLVRPTTEAKLQLWKLEKAAYGKKRSLENQRQLVLHIQNTEGLSMAAASVKADASAKAWHTSLGNVATKGTNPHKADLKAIKQIDKNKIPNEGTPFNRALGVPYERGGGEKKSKNPYKNEMTAATQKEIAAIIGRKGTAFAASNLKQGSPYAKTPEHLCRDLERNRRRRFYRCCCVQVRHQ